MKSLVLQKQHHCQSITGLVSALEVRGYWRRKSNKIQQEKNADFASSSIVPTHLPDKKSTRL